MHMPLDRRVQLLLDGERYEGRSRCVALERCRASHRLQARDALHTATALVHGVPAIVSSDDDFDDVEGLSRLTPADAAARL